MLFIVLDHTGYGQLVCHGSPIATPNLDSLAAGGLLYTNMHTTALCSPSRSCIITGRNHHANATAAINGIATGYPGYNGSIPFENGFLSEMLLSHGYSTYLVGKYHLLPSEFESPAGPFDRWPLGRGFERFYGFLGGDTSHWYPDLVCDNHQVEPPGTAEDGYHLTEDLVDKAIGFIADAKQVAPEKPFYLHFCLGATHAPHHVPRQWADRYAGQFDDGWDVYRRQVFAREKELGIMPADVPDWDSLPPEVRRLAARMMGHRHSSGFRRAGSSRPRDVKIQLRIPLPEPPAGGRPRCKPGKPGPDDGTEPAASSKDSLRSLHDHQRRLLPHASSPSPRRNPASQAMNNPRGGDFQLATSGDRRNMAIDTALRAWVENALTGAAH